ncbi:hypothetical protein GJR96_04545 [Haloferax sp. MBLA0076]|uniref:Uncharacterized protein n=1 Tax=Haloferax litoreum TaxID=2666140 RepID=A0A6A8GDJ5_9EURY|nr:MULTISPECIES: hypothetical protein [Haloferax]KAB1192748.1 hypothetical protein Hfx1148_04535 [Haloferax sp. CBA1148]MRX21228.1 hypothetical protein [Haloferax litoreum]
MVHFVCEECGVRVSNDVALLRDESQLCEDGWSVHREKQQGYVPEGRYVVGSPDHIFYDVEGDYLLNPDDIIMMDRLEAAPPKEYASFFGCCGPTGRKPNTFCENGHKFATEMSDHCSPVVQLHVERVRMV